jgi:hypothetical protein
MTVFAGGTGEGTADGRRTAALFNKSEGLALHEDGTLFVADRSNNLIRKISSSGNVSTLAGSGLSAISNGIGSKASFYFPYGLALDRMESFAEGLLFVSEGPNIRKIEIATGNITVLAGALSLSFGYQDGLGTGAKFN